MQVRRRAGVRTFFFTVLSVAAFALAAPAEEDSQDEEETPCVKACYEVEDRCYERCSEAEDFDRCEEACEKKADACLEKCE